MEVEASAVVVVTVNNRMALLTLFLVHSLTYLFTNLIAMGSFVHPCEGEMVCKSINTKIPYFNAPIYLENKTQIGKVDEILGPLNEVYFTVKLQDGVQATSFKANDKVFIAPDKLLPVDRFLPKSASAGRTGKPVGRQGMVEF